MKTILRNLTDLFFPKVCQHCGDSFKDGLSNILCRSCFDSVVPFEDPLCEHCGFPLPARGFEDALQKRCRDCGDQDYFLDRVRAFGSYEGPVRIMHHAFKFEGMESLKTNIAIKMADMTTGHFLDGVEALTAVPLSPERERERGYNPASLIAEEISRQVNIPTRALLKKSLSTRPQMSLKRAERMKNPLGAYSVVEGNLPTKIILIDDVYTTGATLEECAKVLKKAGVVWVGALVFGRTPHH